MILQPGDIILFNSANITTKKIAKKLLKLQHKIDKGTANHAAIYYEKNMILESSWSGVFLRYFNEDTKSGNYCILRHKNKINKSKIKKIIYNYYVFNKNIGYSFKGLLNASLASLFSYFISFFTFGKINKKINIFRDEQAPFCSELVAEIYEIYLNKNLHIKNSIISPNDLYKSKEFKIIQDFNKTTKRESLFFLWFMLTLTLFFIFMLIVYY